MPIGLIGRKIGMTRIFRESGEVVPVTVIEAGPCPVIMVRTPERDGYSAIQVGFIDVKKSKLKKPLAGHFPENVPAKRMLREFRLEDGNADFSVGQVLRVDIFEAGQKIDVRGRSKGKGTAGTIKRHGFAGGPKTHGSNFHRIPGAIGNSSDPHKVFKGKKMAGRLGNETICVQNLEVVQVNADDNTLAVRGAIPGPTNGMVILTPAVKVKRQKKGRAA